MHDAVLFDLGGVVLGSPLAALREFEVRHGLEPNAIGAAIKRTGRDGAWARLERGELEFSRFEATMNEELVQAGVAVCVARMMRELEACMTPRDTMLQAVRSLRASGFAVGAVTNNWLSTPEMTNRFDHLRGEFDAFVESYRVGHRKPEAAIYRIACERVGVPPERTVFLDDIGANLKTARALGMATIKVQAPHAALAALESLLAGRWRSPTITPR